MESRSGNPFNRAKFGRGKTISCFPHGKMLLRRAKGELAAISRLKCLEQSVPLTNDAWSIFLHILVDSLEGRSSAITRLSQRLLLSRDAVIRYLRVLEFDRLILCSDLNNKNPKIEIYASVADSGLLRAARLFLPEAANE